MTVQHNLKAIRLLQPGPARVGSIFCAAFRPARAGARARGETGSTVIIGVVAIGLLLVVFAGATNVVLDEYAKGALRTAVDEAAQAGAAAGGSQVACEHEAAQVRSGLLHGGFGADVIVTCGLLTSPGAAEAVMVARATGSLPSLVPTVPGLHVAVTGISVVQGQPPQ